jgi:formamidopyrimidine-DNA glycosylase
MIFRLKNPLVILSPHVAKNPLQQTRGILRLRPQDDNQGIALLVHLKMTGQLIYEKEVRSKDQGTKVEIVAGGHKMSENDINALPNQWTRIAFVFADGGELFFNDVRLFGYMKLETPERIEKALQKFGPEPFGKEFTFEYFSVLFKKRANTNLKALLLNQELVAGLGNIYVDEACYRAGVRPMRRVGSITKVEQKKLFESIPKILAEALKHRGTTFRNFLDSSGKKGNYTDFLRVYDRDGLPCKKCKTVILKTKVAGRGTHYCPRCQKQ